MNREGLKELDRRLSRVETALPWLLAAAWLCGRHPGRSGRLGGAGLAPMVVLHDELIRLIQEASYGFYSLSVTCLNCTP